MIELDRSARDTLVMLAHAHMIHRSALHLSAVLLLALPSSAIQLPCASAVGPDVVIGDMPDVANYAPFNGLDAISIGTTLCNLGSAPVHWASSTNQHPVYGSNLYRYRVVAGSGRFEQIGMSWLQHGFFPSQGTHCCTCTPPAAMDTLGVGCSDPETAFRNGSQSALGPRWQVNATTGAFAYPPQNPIWSGSTARRLEFDLADIDTSPAVAYWGESLIVAADDAAAANANDNASHRALAVSGTASNWSFAWTGALIALEPAIREWPLVEPGVTLTDAQVPSTGLFLIGSHATSLGAGVWHYEFALYNHDADRNAGSFTVPLPPGATVTNIGFHDVTYRNGDGPGNLNVSNVDWPPVVSATSISWSSQTEAQNPNANAVRWGTTYNFRFDTDVPPTIGLVTVGLWKSGAPADFTALAQIPLTIGSAGIAFCAGDGTSTNCPCSNISPIGADAGCLNSFGQGATVIASGGASIALDTLTLDGASMPATSTCLYFQGTAPVNGGAGIAFGDGLRCVAGTVIRLGTKTNINGASRYPTSTDQSIHVRGNVLAGDARHYQIWYRNQASFCTPDGFNLTNGWTTTWAP